MYSDKYNHDKEMKAMRDYNDKLSEKLEFTMCEKDELFDELLKSKKREQNFEESVKFKMLIEAKLALLVLIGISLSLITIVIVDLKE